MKTYQLALIALCANFCANAQSIVPLPFGDFNTWTTREVKESSIIGGKTKTLYDIGLDNSPWATSNVVAKVAGVTKCSNAVFCDTIDGTDRCVKMTTILDEVKALGIINMKVLVSGTIFLGEMIQPVTSTKNPYSKMNMGIPFNKRPTHLIFDYKVSVPTDNKIIYSDGFGSPKQRQGSDKAEILIILQRRWEDENGNLHAMRVGTGRERFSTSTDWKRQHHLPILYGDITSHPDYKPYMTLLCNDKAYYARNSQGKMVPIEEEGWDNINSTPTHLLIMASSGCGTPYTGTIGMTFWLDNIALRY